MARGEILAELEGFNPRAPCGARPFRVDFSYKPIIVSIHAPHAGRDTPSAVSSTDVTGFQSTRPMRGATREAEIYLDLLSRFNPRAPCGARPQYTDTRESRFGFQSTRPMRGATGHWISDLGTSLVSIHAPHAGRDLGLPAFSDSG